MTDEELIVWLRSLKGLGWTGEAAARIEALIAERDDYAHKLMQANNTYTEMHLEIERLSDKLAKVVGVLIMAFRYNTTMHRGAGEYNKLIKETIAELTGNTHDPL
jgi:hypothetical protein